MAAPSFGAAAPDAAASVITQVHAQAPALFPGFVSATTAPDSIITLDLRGHNFYLPREELMSLPESILLGLFPNGVFVDGQGHMVSTISSASVLAIDFSPQCLQYVLDTFRTAAKSLQPSPTASPLSSPLGGPAAAASSPAAILAAKPAIIILQEDLDYYIIPPSTIRHYHHIASPSSPSPVSPTSSSRRLSRILHYSHSHHDSSSSSFRLPSAEHPVHLPVAYDPLYKDDYTLESPNFADMVQLKIGVAKKLLCERGIFSALKRARQLAEHPSQPAAASGTTASSSPTTTELPHGETPEHFKAAGTAEKHLLDMLCSSGFHPKDEWGFREREPGKTVISSLALVRLLATTPAPVPAGSELNELATDHAQEEILNPMAQKLLLFWRKPARKCWWDQLTLTGVDGFDPELEIKVHVRRMWTLELSVIGVH
ncbi:uncharacterized protein V1518DRAFT_411088 [Limtongia smithiae]|uniref:uncharacterized protein n=1 Tax=Limtongia smithiae TaxID=1125753 RepID=UPI0034CD8762